MAVPVPPHPGNTGKNPRCQRQLPAPPASPGERGSLRDARPLWSCSSPAEPDPRGPRDPRTLSILQPSPPARSQLQESQGSSPVPGEGVNHRGPPPVRPLQISKRLVLLLLPSVPHARTSAGSETRRVIFNPSNPARQKSPLRSVPGVIWPAKGAGALLAESSFAHRYPTDATRRKPPAKW